ncbi:MAG TPA: hypothetical protein VNX28_14900 [Gemmataceae bacterium]|nr:hypothetical protein [Gemmataceae bacterium]
MRRHTIALIFALTASALASRARADTFNYTFSGSVLGYAITGQGTAQVNLIGADENISGISFTIAGSTGYSGDYTEFQDSTGYSYGDTTGIFAINLGPNSNWTPAPGSSSPPWDPLLLFQKENFNFFVGGAFEYQVFFGQGIPYSGGSVQDAPLQYGPEFATITVSDFSPATPLPAALPLFATGLGALGLLGWRRKRKADIAAV